MTTLTAGSTANFSLSGRQVLTLTADNNTTGTIKRTQYVESSSSKTDTLGPPATNRTYGPFGHETDIELTCTYGSFEYDVTGTSLVTAGTDPVTGGIAGFLVGSRFHPVHNPLGTNTAALFGDSRITQQFADLTMSSASGAYEAKGWFHWLQFAAGHPFSLITTAGKSGDKIADMSARMYNPQGGAMFGNVANPGWVCHRPKWLFITAGINDILNGVATATSVANARTIIDAALAQGAIVVWPNEYLPGGEGSALSAGALSLLDAWNAALAGLKTDYKNLIVPDVYSAFYDPESAGYSYTGVMNDGSGQWIHPNNAGGQLYGKTVYDAVADYLPEPSRIVLAGDANELISVNSYCNQYQVNPLLAGASLGAAGVAAANGGGATSTVKLIADPSGFGQAIQIDANFTSAAAAYVFVTLFDSKANVVGGERLVGACAIAYGSAGGSDGTIASIDESAKFRTVMHSLAVTDAVAAGGAANVRNVLDASASIAASNDAGIRCALSGVSVTPPYQTKAGTPQLVQQQFYIRGTANGGAVRVIISRPTIRRVPDAHVQLPVIG